MALPTVEEGHLGDEGTEKRGTCVRGATRRKAGSNKERVFGQVEVDFSAMTTPWDIPGGSEVSVL